MLYLEDFLELIETLPNEVRDKCTTVRELDLSVQNQVELLQKKMQSISGGTGGGGGTTSGGSGTKSSQAGGGVNKQQQQQEVDIEEKKRVLEEVERGYRGALVDAGEKVSVVGQLFHLVERYSRRLDQDLNKFKWELEADNAGITQILEAKVSRQLAEEEALSKYAQLGAAASSTSSSFVTTDNVTSSDLNNGTGGSSSSSSSLKINSRLQQQGHNKNSRHSSSIKTSSQHQSRRPETEAPRSSASSVGTYRPYNNYSSSTPLAMKREPPYGEGEGGDEEDEGEGEFDNDDEGDEWVQGHRKSSTFGFYTPPTSPPDSKSFEGFSGHQEERYTLPKSLDMLEKVTENLAKNYNSASREYESNMIKNRPKRQLSIERIRAASGVGGSIPAYVPSGIDSSQYVLSPIIGSNKQRKRKLDSSYNTHNSSYNSSGNTSQTDNDTSGDDTNHDSNADSSEQRWCICNEYSYGNMIACDNVDCPIEWFHYPCVGIPEAGISKKKWYCPKCKVKEKLKKKSSSYKKG